MSNALLRWTPTAQIVVLVLVAFFAWRGWVRGWDREWRLLVWLLIGLAVVSLGGAFLIQRINGFYIGFRILAQAGFDVQAAFKVAGEEYANIPPLIPKDRESLALALIFLGFAWWGSRQSGRTSQATTRPGSGSGGLSSLPGAILGSIPAIILGGINGFIIAYYLVPQVFKIGTTPVEQTVVTMPIASILQFLQENVVNVIIALIGVTLLRLFQTGVRASNKGK
jgi:hypothetical protein